MYYCCHYTSPIGRLTLASDGEALTGLWLEGQKFFTHNHAGPVEMHDLPVFRDATVWLDRYFAGNPVTPDDLPLKPDGTAFQQKVWDILKSIPYGQTVTYGQIAYFLDCPKASQAVGAAVGRNPISIIIPCHRVVGAGGKLTGYAGGLPAKAWLLRHERSDASKLITGFNRPSLVISSLKCYNILYISQRTRTTHELSTFPGSDHRTGIPTVPLRRGNLPGRRKHQQDSFCLRHPIGNLRHPQLSDCNDHDQ